MKYEIGQEVQVKEGIPLEGVYEEDKKYLREEVHSMGRIMKINKYDKSIPYILDIDFPQGNPSFRESEIELIPCECGHDDRMYSDKRRRWICPFCEGK